MLASENFRFSGLGKQAQSGQIMEHTSPAARVLHLHECIFDLAVAVGFDIAKLYTSLSGRIHPASSRFNQGLALLLHSALVSKNKILG